MAKAKQPKTRVYCFDLDGTLCTNTEGAYQRAKPFPRRIARVNALYDAGHEIVISTARGSKTGIDWKVFTERQLRKWNVKHHRLHLGKPYADIYIDDKALHVTAWVKIRREK